jgi:hypothetical protein
MSERVHRESNGGADGSRTHDLLNAIQALSQLSYGPTSGGVIGGCRRKTKKQRPKSQTHLKISFVGLLGGI